MDKEIIGHKDAGMKKIIDVNYFRDPTLNDYLRSDKRNFVVFSDYACMEAYKGNAIKNIFKSIEIVSKFPNQVIVLKETRDIIKLSLSPDGFNKFEDPAQTREFKIFCLGVIHAFKGDTALESQIVRNCKLASENFNKLLEDTEFIVKGIKELTKTFKPEHLKALKKREKLEPEIIDRIVKDILIVAALLFQDHPDVTEMPQASQLPNSYLLRYAISFCLLTLQWISNGGAGNVKREKLRNDFVDMHYVTYATFYDGLLTNDSKMKAIYNETCFVLKNIFHTEPGPGCWMN